MILLKLFWKELGKKSFLIIFMAILNGILATTTIAIINDLISEKPKYDFYYFPLILIVSFILGRTYSVFMLHISNNLVYKLRIDILSKIQNISFANFEKKNKNNESFIYSILTRDISLMASIPSAMVGYLTSVFTILSSLVYLYINSPYGTLGVLAVVLFCILVFHFSTRNVDKYDKELRLLSDKHFNFINILIKGFREFKIDRKKQRDFKENYMDDSSEQIRVNSVKFGSKIINAEVINGALFLGIIGAFLYINNVFNLLSPELNSIFVLTFIFISDSIESVVGAFPYLTRVKTSLERVNEIDDFFQNEQEENPPVNLAIANEIRNNWQNIKFNNVSFTYKQEDDHPFTIGPVSLNIERGDTIFITGGNGSGKTTFMKLLLSLYKPDNGTIILNDKFDVQSMKSAYRNLYSLIFSDNHLFRYFYGYRNELDKLNVDELIEKLGLDGKVKVANGQFDTIDLSIGQRKRLALLYMLIENKDIIVLDEFTADQDPSFRKYFYKDILQDLKSKGKTLIIITHDDRYFHYGDRLIKIEDGQLQELNFDKVL
jgi:putative pyoverdin transport system ATP-binding/permease protein